MFSPRHGADSATGSTRACIDIWLLNSTQCLDGGSLREPPWANYSHAVDTNRFLPSIISFRASTDVNYWLDIEPTALIRDTDIDLIPYVVLDCKDWELKIDTLKD